MDPGSVVFGRYRLLERIGAGGAGVVWKATDELLDQTVALKRVPFADPAHDTLADDARRTRERALREARLAAQLREHPHVITVFDVLADEHAIWLVMDYHPARSLREILRTRTRLSPTETARIGAQIADALAAAHAQRIEHRDVKPGNILLTTAGSAKLTDFGISRLTSDPHLTGTATTCTPAYAAPEVAARGEFSPAADIYSLGATLYAAVEGHPPFGTDDNTYRLLGRIRTGIITPPTRAGPLEPLLQRLLHINPTTRPDAPTTHHLLTQLSQGNAPTPARPPRLEWLRRAQRAHWPTRRRTTLAVSTALLTVIIAIGVMIILPDPADPPDNPRRLSAINDPRDADPCGLINLATLEQFGDPRWLTPPPWLESCHARIRTADGHETHLEVMLDNQPESLPALSGTLRQDGDMTIVQRNLIDLVHAGTTACQNLLVLENQPLVAISTFDYHNREIDLCAVTEAATATATAEIKRRGGLPYVPGRTAEYSYADSDACAMLDATALSKVPGLNVHDRKSGFANWSCSWGTQAQGSPSVSARFRLDDPALTDDHGEPAPAVLGKPAFLSSYPGSCRIQVAHRPTVTVTELFELAVDGSQATEELCVLAVDLATAAESWLSTQPRDADPCALLPDPASLAAFGQAERTAGSYLHACELTITAPGRSIQLWVGFNLPQPVSKIGGRREQVGDLAVFRDNQIPHGGRYECSTQVWLADDQPLIYLETRTYDDDPDINLCAVTDAATAAATTTLQRDGGISYSPNRTSVYSHASSDACALLDPTDLARVPGLNPDAPEPGFARWSCAWHGNDDTEVLLELMLQEPDFSGYQDGDHRPLAGKAASLSGEPGDCTADVTHRRGDPAAGRATEMFRLAVVAPLATSQLCELAGGLATAVEERLPDT